MSPTWNTLSRPALRWLTITIPLPAGSSSGTSRYRRPSHLNSITRWPASSPSPPWSTLPLPRRWPVRAMCLEHPLPHYRLPPLLLRLKQLQLVPPEEPCPRLWMPTPWISSCQCPLALLPWMWPSCRCRPEPLMPVCHGPRDSPRTGHRRSRGVSPASLLNPIGPRIIINLTETKRAIPTDHQTAVTSPPSEYNKHIDNKLAI